VLENLINHYYLVIWSIKTVSAFTQIVWKGTSEIGLTFRCEENQYIVLAVYNPAGNYPSRYTSNVILPIYSWPAADPEIRGLIYQTGSYIHLKKLKCM